MYKKNNRILIVFLLIFSFVITSVSIYGDHTPKSGRDIKLLLLEKNSNLFTNTEVNIKNNSSEILDKYTEDSYLEINMNWSIPEELEGKLQQGDFYDLDIPNNLTDISIHKSENIQLNKDTIRIYIDTNLSGYLKFNAKLKDSDFQEEIIEFKDAITTQSIVITRKEVSDLGASSENSAVKDSVSEDDTHLQSVAQFSKPSSIAVSRFKVYTEPTKTTYLSGEEIVFYVGVSLTDESSTLSNAHLSVRIPKKNIVKSTLSASDISSQLNKKISEIDDYYIIDYELKPLGAGASLDIPFKFETHNGETPNGFAISVEASISKDDNDTLSSDALDFTINTNKPKIEKFIYNGNFKTNKDMNTVLAGYEKNKEQTMLSESLTDLEYVRFSYSLSTGDSAESAGSRLYDHVVIEDKIPDDAVFVAEDNKGWTFDEKNRIAKYVFESEQGVHLVPNLFLDKVFLKLKFPNAKVGVTRINNVTATSTPKNMDSLESPDIVSDDIKFVLKARPKTLINGSKSISYSEFYDYQKDREKVFTWNLTASNAIGGEEQFVTLGSLEIKDYGLDERLKYTELKIPKQEYFKGTLSIIASMKDGNQIILGNDLSTENDQSFKLNEETVSISILTSEDSVIENSKSLKVYIDTMLRDTELDVVPDNVVVTYLENKADFNISAKEGQTETNSVRSTIRFYKVRPSVTLNKKIENSKKDYFMDDLIKYSLSLDFNNFLGDSNYIDGTKIVDILPIGNDYISGSSNVKIASNVSSNIKSHVNDPEIIHNYKESGQTALVWDLGKLEYKGNNSMGYMRGSVIVSYSTRLTSFASQGQNKNEAYLSWVNSDIVKAAGETQKDLYDLNNNGDYEELISKSNVQFNYVPPRELLIRKEVKGSLDSRYLLPPSKGLSELDTLVSYRFRMDNYSITDIKTLSFIDLIPDLNDKTASEDVTQGSKRIPRNSNFKLMLSGPITLPEGLNVYYTTDTIPNDIRDFYKNAIWQSHLDDYQSATAFKIELENGFVFESGKGFAFDIDFKVPNNLKLNDGDKAVNSFGVSTSSNLDFFESNISTLEIVKYAVTGTVFDDFNEDGVFDKTIDDTIAKHRVRLVDQDGNEVVDKDGKPYETVTDDHGNYTINVLHQGTYRVKILTPEGFEITKTVEESNGSHLENNSSQISKEFTLNSDNRKAIINAGFYKKDTSVEVVKVLTNHQGDIIKKEQSFEFLVHIENKHDGLDSMIPYSGNGAILQDNSENKERVIQIINGKVQIPANHKLVIMGLPKFTKLKIVEQNSSKYDVDGGIIDTITDKTHKSFTVINTLKNEKTSFTAQKIWIGGPSIKPDVSLQLYRDGSPYLTPIILQNGNTEYTWDNLDKTDLEGNVYSYTVDELNVPENYTKTINGTTITNTYLQKFEDIEVTKEWIGGPMDKPTVEINLFANGIIVGETAILESGATNYIWKDMPVTDLLGNPISYTVDEVNVPKDYSKHVDEFTITNTYTPGKQTVQVQKVWVGGPKEKPSISVQLYRNNIEFGEVVEMTPGVTTYIWENLDVFDENGNTYGYTVDEIDVPKGYNKTINGMTITNTFMQEDDLNSDTNKPESKDEKQNYLYDEDEKLPSTGHRSVYGRISLIILFSGVVTLLFSNKKKNQ
ncbi:Cna B-type domain-containing protein [Erysipelothrix rhusiopathiae]|nr:Cna B-type domain-containing protein [Erysipelothrix rhusiopathiae]MDE8258951.1 Cna B-type domain-containing protein [Erysipelothrix rhusiopathiae]MDE8259145.1 Cna B-type domain-containing protein [Erysipelothrix rhusiopathiae]MDE8271328.1 Cna B-type domain-containing protein [Erysipelothrix rhusiopathiae]MDE8273072.1 Cna B-type domain-containing protein [Erysipelothrix rhusiopathiae]